ncbi:hypothetical protein PoB_006545800 [Plakobranchus ocellatus]|uniref:Secreted protein n=1 Tax=Plakobranchus ocellatus TaxID=259542 RepID=A0AAV4D437_9GAST|nr:hypothetical protein PoB_006545800 [Plakobranchus ocellatus]
MWRFSITYLAVSQVQPLIFIVTFAILHSRALLEISVTLLVPPSDICSQSLHKAYTRQGRITWFYVPLRYALNLPIDSPMRTAQAQQQCVRTTSLPQKPRCQSPHRHDVLCPSSSRRPVRFTRIQHPMGRLLAHKTATVPHLTWPFTTVITRGLLVIAVWTA